MKHPKINTCPVCKESELKTHLKTKDHYFSKEEFEILMCPTCKLGITSPQPSQEDIGPYYDTNNYISHGKAKTGFISKMYSWAQKRNFLSKYRLIRSLKYHNSVLDYGAGSGYFVQQMNGRGVNSEGFEPNAEARKNALELNGILLKSEIPVNPHDVITMWHVLEHVHDLRGVLKDLANKLNAGGHLIVALPNYNSKDANHYGPFWAAYDVPRHLWHFNQTSIVKLVAQFGLAHTKTLPMKFDAFYVSILSEKFKGGGIIRGLYNGLISNLSAKRTNFYSSQIYVFRKEV